MNTGSPKAICQSFSCLSVISGQTVSVYPRKPVSPSWDPALVADHASPLAGFADVPACERLRRRRKGGWREQPRLVPSGRGMRHHFTLGKSPRWLRRHRKGAVLDFGRPVVDIRGRPVPETPDIERSRDDDGPVITARAATAEKQRQPHEKRHNPSKHQQYPCRCLYSGFDAVDNRAEQCRPCWSICLTGR